MPTSARVVRVLRDAFLFFRLPGFLDSEARVWLFVSAACGLGRSLPPSFLSSSPTRKPAGAGHAGKEKSLWGGAARSIARTRPRALCQRGQASQGSRDKAGKSGKMESGTELFLTLKCRAASTGRFAAVSAGSAQVSAVCRAFRPGRDEQGANPDGRGRRRRRDPSIFSTSSFLVLDTASRT